MIKKHLNLGYGVPCVIQLHGHQMPDGMKAELRYPRTLAKDLNEVKGMRKPENLRPWPCL